MIEDCLYYSISSIIDIKYNWLQKQTEEQNSGFSVGISPKLFLTGNSMSIHLALAPTNVFRTVLCVTFSHKTADVGLLC